MSTTNGARWSAIRAVSRFETAKLLAQWPTRLLPLVCVLAPVAFGLVLRIQSGVPADTLFGVWVHTSGFAVPLVILSFAGAWGFPIIAGIVGGDMFASEDRLGTWKTLLTRSCGREEIFLGKALTAFAYTVAMVVLLAAGSMLAGVVATGTQPLVGLTGQTVSSGNAAALTVASWGIALLPALGFTALALLISALTRSSAAGMLGPLVVALAMQLLGLFGSGDIVRTLLLSTTLDAWNGLFAAPSYTRPLAWAALISLCYITACLEGAWLSLRRRDIAGTGSEERTWGRQLRVSGVAVAVVALLGVVSNLGPTSVTATKLAHSIESTFSNLAVLQQEDLGRHVPPGSHLGNGAVCSRRGVRDTQRGPGDDWLCSIYVPSKSLSQPTEVSYDVTVKPNGCYTAEGPESFIGPLTLHRPNGQTVLNPLFRFSSCFEVAP
ncbi:MAG TPA: ABC transporter permease [Gaiellaceae bacterium]